MKRPTINPLTNKNGKRFIVQVMTDEDKTLVYKEGTGQKMVFTEDLQQAKEYTDLIVANKKTIAIGYAHARLKFRAIEVTTICVES